jgi:hypothetical protein
LGDNDLGQDFSGAKSGFERPLLKGQGKGWETGETGEEFDFDLFTNSILTGLTGLPLFSPVPPEVGLRSRLRSAAN